MNIKEVSIFVEHVPGKFLEVVKTLTENNIHVRSFCAAELGGIVVLRLIVDNVLWTASILKTMGYPATFTEVIAVSLPNSPESFCRVLEVMKGAGINIEYAYPFPMRDYSAGIIFEVDDTARAAEILTDAGIRVITQDELPVL